jgi:hypothetical protein
MSVLALLAMPSLVFAQGAPPSASAPVTVGGVTLIGPSPPIAPDTAARDTDGHATLRATRIDETLRIDGHLDETVYHTVQPIGGFIQTEPQPGEPATEATDVWIFFDDRAIYVAARCWDSAPESRWVANEMRRDNTNVVRNENVAVLFDTYYDHRNGFVFELSPVGGVYDASVTNERSPGNPEWNPIWERKAGRFEHGWIAEMAIPFKSLRYKPGTPQVWGFNMRRTVRWKNEESFITRMVPNPGSPLFQVSQEGVLVGVEVPSASLNLEMKPYGISSMTTDRRSTPAVLNDGHADAGFDVKYGVSQNLTADFTYNTDFAQVEVDEQQVNLTRFTLFFPEKREFFLEGQGIYDFGGASSSASGGGGQGLTPLLFFSRRIGLNQIGTLNRVVPINAGGRLTGKVGRTTIGLLNVYAGDDPAAGGARATDFSVVRVRRDLFRRSSVGLLFTERSVSTVGSGSSESYGVDTTIGLQSNLAINAYVATTRSPNLRDDDVSYRGDFNYNADRYGVELERLVVGTNFNPDVGFLRRAGIHNNSALLRFSPRPRRGHYQAVRRFTYQTDFSYLTNSAGRLETRTADALFGIEFQNSDRLNMQYTRSYEYLAAPFSIATGVKIPVGAYAFEEGRATMSLGNQRKVSGSISAGYGSFYDGHRTTASYSGGRIQINPRFTIEPSVSINWVDLPEGEFTTRLISDRTTFTLTPFAFISGLVQYNVGARSLSSNLRFRWEYRPGSELFVVYTDERDTLTSGFPDLKNRAVVVKINRLLRM